VTNRSQSRYKTMLSQQGKSSLTDSSTDSPKDIPSSDDTAGLLLMLPLMLLKIFQSQLILIHGIDLT